MSAKISEEIPNRSRSLRFLGSGLLLICICVPLGCNSDSPTEPPPPPPPPSPPPPPPTFQSCELEDPPSIRFTFVPPFGSFEDVEGEVLFEDTPCDSDPFRVAVYIRVPISVFFICKPTAGIFLTPIDENGKWVQDYTTAGADNSATLIIAFLVRKEFQGQCVTTTLPVVDGDMVLGRVGVSR